MAYRVQTCPACGHSSFDISTGQDSTLRIVRSAAYRKVRADDRLPAEARRYLCAAMLIEAEQEDDGERAATHGFWELWAAWSCEDFDDPDGAVACRRRAVKSLSRCLASGGTFIRLAGMDYVVIADCLRRCGDFAASLDWIERGLAAEIDPRARVQLDYERSLAEAADTAAHREDETPGLADLVEDSFLSDVLF
jgi:hypothetical protein